ncbi:gamma-tubulin complex component 6-like isoform X1 [Lytechinus variegatus]|uniref:gamma-tubulin complex component 6-like isoform X1 n=1 Tax=Lytechinus variegatus TaxID=7654 RepID=UPI001BB2B555|nr:gamma-tubulin complex component 6-like isoform X1 [Lytechinus variegatus]XP_041460038.1 gamma-tubulin complex component 6-like isoform X1 [Lytechinus variegatus]XP_041460039.1 gamma-tubulin complex component 6-like isoform X1 [Lytechinus variegatus]XP_041460040.1 gamma-tubulin complex component 6-like isoform X1 [Lytechinus variegatus]
MATLDPTSPQQLFKDLVRRAVSDTLGSSHPIRLGEDAEDIARFRQRLQTRLFNSLFGSLPGPLQHSCSARSNAAGIYSPKEQLVIVIFKLRVERRFDEAQQMELILDRLSKLSVEEDGVFLEGVIKFLLVLSGTKQSSHKAIIGHQKPNLPTVGLTSKEDIAALPGGDWFHGDGKHIHKCDEHRPFVNYSRELFEGPSIDQFANDSGISEMSNNDSLLNNKIFEAEPGQDLRGNRLFAVKSLMGNAYERKVRGSLFGGLVHSRVKHIDAKLSLPELPDTTNPAFLGIKVPAFAESALSDDEGYHESMSGSVTSAMSTPEKENIWDAALRYKPSRHRTWENIGNHPRPTERPYLTEAGPGALDLVYQLRCKEAAILQPTTKPPLIVLKDQHRLVQHTWNVLIGLPSDVFLYDEETMAFRVNSQICLTGTTPESIQQLLSELAQAGTDYTRLWHTSQQPITNSTYTGGLVLQAFLGAVRRYLQYYNAQVLLTQSRLEQDAGGDGVRRKVTVLVIRAMFSGLLAQLRYLARLCGCDMRKGTKPGGPDDPLPIGIQLLSALYQEALDCTGTENYRLMLSLLRSACAPYLMFIQDWVFHGICRDAYGEFMIQANHTFLFYRDKHYWTHGYGLLTGENKSAVPLFLQELSSEMYVCGKTINLLKLCAPEHFICSPTVDPPCVGLTFSTEELDQVTSRTKTYVKHMEVLAGQLTVSRREKERREEEARIELLAVARRTAAEEQQKHNEIMKERRQAIGAKKRKELNDLKEQMQKDLLRRGQELEDEKEEDRERMEEVARRQMAIEEAESELEKQAREEVIQFYSELAKEATMREQRALWRIRRRQLDQQRIEFLQNDKEAVKQALNTPPAPPSLAAAGTEVAESTEAREFAVRFADTVPKAAATAVDGEIKPTVISSAEKRTAEGTAPSEGDAKMDSATEANAPIKVPDDGTAGATEVQEVLIDFADESEQQDTEVQEVSMEFGKESEQQADDIDKDHGDELEVGEEKNEDIEPVLALIRGDKGGTGDGGSARVASKETRKQKASKGISISEFLPKDQFDGDDALQYLDEEQAKDTTMDDVLLEIGSTLPSQGAAVQEETAAGTVGASSILDDIIGTDKRQSVSDDADDRIVGLPHRMHEHGHPSATSLDEDISALGQQRRHDHGHASDSNLTVGQDSAGGPTEEDVSIPGLPQRPHQHGHATDSTIQNLGVIQESTTEESGRLVGVPHRSHVHRHVSESMKGQESGADLMYGTTEKLPQRSHLHGHPSESSIQGAGCAEGEHPSGSAPVKSIHGHISDSSLGQGSEKEQLDEDKKKIVGLPQRSHLHGHASDSAMKGIISGAESETVVPSSRSSQGTVEGEHTSDSGYDTQQPQAFPSSSSSSVITGLPGVPHRRPLAPQRTEPETEESTLPLSNIPHRSHVHGHASDSSLGNLMYPSAVGPSGVGEGRLSLQKDGRVVFSVLKHGHPSDSTAQKLMYPQKETRPEIEEEIVEGIELPVTVWADEGREVTEFDFNMFEGLPNTDLLGRTGFEPLQSEIGDYGVLASQSEDIEATDLLPLPIIIKRSITAPLRAQVWLVNQSILDYFLVDLRVDKHFTALRRFLFLQDGEFGQALCDQIFDKLAQCVHLQELLSPLTLNQILSRAIQLSASSDSEQADNLSFALKWHPSVFKPNAIDTLDCLELRYHVEWPNNIVITDTCLSKYNKVFSFLLQLKRTGWVLRDIHHQLKISAMLHQASGSPQYHQLQLFRHEMQHFVNVMQGYVVNQVIHVSWEEFQKDLKENVHNLDDIREKHGLYLNKAILRCLLNKKAAPVMKIICDILSLVLKVRTQLTSAPWAWDASSSQVIHPCFRNIKKSYMAFKEYSGFLYKVVAKLVTRGYQPHLEEFMLRLNFNDYYQEHKS